MRELPPGWETTLAIHELTGSTLEDAGDHLVLRTADNPDFHWGNCVFVMDESAVDDAERWVETFHSTFPSARWVAIGLVRMPDDPRPWESRGLSLDLDDVLTTKTLPRQTPTPEGYVVRRFDAADWERSVARAMAELGPMSPDDLASYERFVRRQTRSRRALSDREDAAFFGAFADGVLVAELGIVRCGSTARYQSVGTDDDHRRRGLASHLLGVAARWAGDRGCDRWVIVTEATNPAGLAYRGAGFEPDIGSAEAYRPPPRLAV